MKRKNSPLPAAFRALAVAVLLAACGVIVWSALRQSDLNRVLPDLQTQLSTSRGRERKQQAEYDEVSAALPQVEKELAEVQPQADAAAEREEALRAERKDRRAEAKELQQALTEAEAELARLEQDARALLDGEEADTDAP
jgi:peptidoglycan hydrolase CwlO-like protein